MTTQHNGIDLTTGFQLRSPHRPTRTVRPDRAEDLASAVAAACRDGRRIAVQATGHGRTAGADDVVLISTGALSDVRIDPAARSARIEAGATWGSVIAAAADHGLAPLSGSFPGVGAVGYTLGGGSGLLSPSYGYAADRVRAVELITVDGKPRRVTADSDPELFWGLRGAGGNLGVVAALEVELFAVRSVLGGAVAYDLGRDPGLLTAWRDWADRLPEQVLAAATVLSYPELARFPAQLRGRHIARLQLCWPEPDRDLAADHLAELRGLGTPLQDTIGELRYAQSGSIFAEPDRPHAYRGTGWLLGGLPEVALETLASTAGPRAGAMCITGLRRISGAMRRPPAVPDAIGLRQARWSFNVLSPHDPESDDGITAVHRGVLEPWQQSIIGRSLNFTFDPLRPDEVAGAYDPAAVPRLRALREEVDPERMIIAQHAL
ncbi:MAG TPA: FAD-binding oxidoreductase [Microlunatus sp.]